MRNLAIYPYLVNVKYVAESSKEIKVSLGETSSVTARVRFPLLYTDTKSILNYLGQSRMIHEYFRIIPAQLYPIRIKGTIYVESVEDFLKFLIPGIANLFLDLGKIDSIFSAGDLIKAFSSYPKAITLDLDLDDLSDKLTEADNAIKLQKARGLGSYFVYPQIIDKTGEGYTLSFEVKALTELVVPLEVTSRKVIIPKPIEALEVVPDIRTQSSLTQPETTIEE